MVNTQGFVLKTLKYGDSSAILKVYTKDFGITSFLQKGFFNPKKKHLRSLQFPFAMAEFTFRVNRKSSLILPSQINPIYSYSAIFNQPIKMMTLQFLAETTFLAIQEEESNHDLFTFIECQLELFNQKENHYSDFHLFFLLKLSQYLGFSPNATQNTYPYFDLQEGKFSLDKNATFILNQEETIVWSKLLDSNFDAQTPSLFNQKERNLLTLILLNYFKLHIPDFREPHSLEIIKEVLNS